MAGGDLPGRLSAGADFTAFDLAQDALRVGHGGAGGEAHGVWSFLGLSV